MKEWARRLFKNALDAVIEHFTKPHITTGPLVDCLLCGGTLVIDKRDLPEVLRYTNEKRVAPCIRVEMAVEDCAEEQRTKVKDKCCVLSLCKVPSHTRKGAVLDGLE